MTITTKGPGDFDPPEEPAPKLYRCGSCGDEFTDDDTPDGDCPTCGESHASVINDEPDGDPGEPDDYIDEAAAWGGRDYP